MSDKVRMSLVQGMGDYARQNRLNRLKKKYGAAPPAMAADMMKQDEAVDAAHMPEAKNDPDKPMEGGEAMLSGMKDVNADAAAGNQDYKSALGLNNDDEEEMMKWMAKQQMEKQRG